ncbi:phage tail assembly chaperone [Janthinobacterium fluminis]|uniref:Phage tail assembly chaperone n=1 Tax=Janthinobacterium fluminis TaxID=2987524 RepID=A0ABT5JU40_9BURK|nr:phage tail assembly chaperone [Janthinobacterium fluminis]MDC8756262.1 phage tail assembly chaperone [Janthinobacterium fluminis]
MATQKQKLKLGSTPKSFLKSVEIVMLDGSVETIEISYQYRTRSQFAALVDARIASAAAPAVADSPAPEKTVAEWFRLADEGAVEFVLKIADGWDLEDPFIEKSLLQLEDENPGALAAIATAYRQAVAEVRTKN